MTLTVAEAASIAAAFVRQVAKESGLDLAILKSDDFDIGVVYYYARNSAANGDPFEGLVGNSPIFVDTRTGTLVVLGTARDASYYVDEYRHGRFPKLEAKDRDR